MSRDEALMEAVRRIDAERERQKHVEGWNDAHDDQHTDGSLLRAAVIYLHCDPDNPLATPMNGNVPLGWPWHSDWWKPRDRVRNLERAGALALAEVDRRRRAGLAEEPARHKYHLAANKLAAALEPSP